MPTEPAARLLLWLALLTAPAAQALPTDRDQPIEVTADQAVQEGNVVTYTGEVVIVQGSLRIDADKVVVHSDGHRIQRMVATGNRARLQQLPEPDGELVKGRARTITYLQQEELMVLEEEAEVEQEGSIVTGQRIDYEIDTEVVRAHSSGSGSDRVQMVLQPEAPRRDPGGD